MSSSVKLDNVVVFLLASHPIYFVDGCIDRQGPQYATRLGNDIFLFGLVYMTYFYKYLSKCGPN